MAIADAMTIDKRILCAIISNRANMTSLMINAMNENMSREDCEIAIEEPAGQVVAPKILHACCSALFSRTPFDAQNFSLRDLQLRSPPISLSTHAKLNRRSHARCCVFSSDVLSFSPDSMSFS
jgi:hypothetical protein